MYPQHTTVTSESKPPRKLEPTITSKSISLSTLLIASTSAYLREDQTCGNSPLSDARRF